MQPGSDVAKFNLKLMVTKIKHAVERIAEIAVGRPSVNRSWTAIG